MGFKRAAFYINGMSRDLAVSEFNPKYAYENKNLRLITTGENTTLALANEKGNIASDIVWEGEGSPAGNYIFGTPIGQQTIGGNLVVFSAGESPEDIDITTEEQNITDITVPIIPDININSAFEDSIYKFWFDSGTLHGKKLFQGPLMFNPEHPIESISVFENEEIQKIYWTDGINQPRVINIEAPDDKIASWNYDSFNFVNTLALKESVEIYKDTSASGLFNPGTIQYVFTYYNLYGQETNIFYSSPLFYTSYIDRGASPDDSVSNSFVISISAPDTNFDFVRVYSILRTSINGTPQVRRVVDLEVPKDKTYLKWVPDTLYDEDDRVYYEDENIRGGYRCINANNDHTFDPQNWVKEYSITYVDNGTVGSTVDATTLLYIGGEDTVVGTLSQKDNTLFMGDIKYNRLVIPEDLQEDIRESITNDAFNADTTLDVLGDFGNFYTYTSQLLFNSRQIKGFKYLEWYRFGVQFQYKTGKWSSPMWLMDKKNESAYPGNAIYKVGTSNEPLKLIKHPIFKCDISEIEQLVELGYVKVRPVVVYPTLKDREVVCQGMLCPTVYNLEDRLNNAPFAQASWFARPNASCDINDDKNDWSDYNTGASNSENSRGASLALENPSSPSFDLINHGAWAEFRHNTALPTSSKRNCEIQCNVYTGTPSVIINDTDDSRDWASRKRDLFCVDQSIVTLNSPDVEFDSQNKLVEFSGLKLRIVGIIPLTAFSADINIQTATPPANKSCLGFVKESFNAENASIFGWKSLISAPLWHDGRKDIIQTETKTSGLFFVIYPWQKTGVLSNLQADSGEYAPGELSQKKLSNSRFSYNSLYLNSGSLWKAEDSLYGKGISDAKLFDSTEVTPIKLKAQGEGFPDILYYGNVDKIILYSKLANGILDFGYPLMVSNYTDNSNISIHEAICSPYVAAGSVSSQLLKNNSTDPIAMKYKSSPHIAIALKNYLDEDNDVQYQRVLPTFKNKKVGSPWTSINPVTTNVEPNKKYYWDDNEILRGVKQDTLSDSAFPYDGSSIDYSTKFGFLWLGELYNDTITADTRFGGQTQEAFEANEWVVAGPEVSLSNYDDSIPSSITVKWTEGDTYYQRYDCLKTYAFTQEDINSVIDIVSFMCETRVNIDGRYDRNRGNISNLYMSPINFNLLNPAYSQHNSFFNYQAFNFNRVLLDKYPNTIVWSKTKTAGEFVDTWTNVTLASSLDLDGDKGRVRALRRFNNNLVAFQDKGISQILYNENVQISSTEGIPIELANSGKVSGKRYLSDSIGCTNKWSICNTPSGIYFIDDVNKGIYLFNGQLNNLSDKLGFRSWVRDRFKDINIWDPVNFEGAVTYFDSVNQDVFFITKDECLAYNEVLGGFTSFYSYEHTPYFSNLEDRGISWQKAEGDMYYKPWLHREGDYNLFFNKYQPFWTTVIVNSEPTRDKVFNNVEFRADSFDSSEQLQPNHTFDYLTTWNEYQEGRVKLENTLNTPSTLKKKFRIWHANIPRWNIDKNGHTANNRDRMRNPWLYLKLSMEDENLLSENHKTILHDLVVDYFE